MADSQRDDRQVIIDHIHGIFQAFLRKDREAIRRAHTSDWVGFMGPSTAIERGIDAYMAHADHSLANFNGSGYEILDSEVQNYGDVAIVYYVARFEYADDTGTTHAIPLRSVDIYRRDGSDWCQAGSHIGVIPGDTNWGQEEK